MRESIVDTVKVDSRFRGNEEMGSVRRNDDYFWIQFKLITL